MAYQLVNLATSFGLKLDSNRPTRLTVLGGLVRQSQAKSRKLLLTRHLVRAFSGTFCNLFAPNLVAVFYFFEQDAEFNSFTLTPERKLPYCSLNLSLNLRYLDRTMIEALHTTMELIAGARVEIVVFLLAACTHYVLFTLRVPLRQD